jgi:hypothetical protein
MKPVLLDTITRETADTMKEDDTTKAEEEIHVTRRGMEDTSQITSEVMIEEMIIIDVIMGTIMVMAQRLLVSTQDVNLVKCLLVNIQGVNQTKGCEEVMIVVTTTTARRTEQ